MRRTRIKVLGWAALGVLALAGRPAAAIPAQDAVAETAPARLTFLRSFPGSVPEYVRVTVAEDGAAVYQEGTIADPGPEEEFQAGEGTVQELFRLSGELNNFLDAKFESGRRVARLGDKTFRYERGAEKREVTYNHTLIPAVSELQNLFEKIVQSRHYLWEIGYRARFDRLGVADVLSKFDLELSQGRLVDPDQFLPVLEKVAKDARLMMLARDKARRLAERIENTSAYLHLEFGDTGANRYADIEVNEDGLGTVDIRRFDEAPNPGPLKIPSLLNQRLWTLVEMTNGFKDEVSTLPPGGRLAGYRLSYEKGLTKSVVSFSSARSGVMAEVINILQRVINQQYHLKRVQQGVEEKSLMLQVALQEMERALRRGELADAEEFLPLLKQIVGDETYHEMDRQIAARVAKQIRMVD